MGDFYDLLVYKNRLNYLCQFELGTSFPRDKCILLPIKSGELQGQQIFV